MSDTLMVGRASVSEWAVRVNACHSPVRPFGAIPARAEVDGEDGGRHALRSGRSAVAAGGPYDPIRWEWAQRPTRYGPIGPRARRRRPRHPRCPHALRRFDGRRRAGPPWWGARWSGPRPCIDLGGDSTRGVRAVRPIRGRMGLTAQPRPDRTSAHVIAVSGPRHPRARPCARSPRPWWASGCGSVRRACASARSRPGRSRRAAPRSHPGRSCGR